jgi:hypothetical protein
MPGMFRSKFHLLEIAMRAHSHLVLDFQRITTIEVLAKYSDCVPNVYPNRTHR